MTDSTWYRLTKSGRRIASVDCSPCVWANGWDHCLSLNRWHQPSSPPLLWSYLTSFTSVALSQFSRIQQPSNLQTLHLKPADITTAFDLENHAAPTKVEIVNTPLQLFVINWSNLTAFEAIRLSMNEIFHSITLTPQMVACLQSDVRYTSTSETVPIMYSRVAHAPTDWVLTPLTNHSIGAVIFT